jgi:hypothetical protein
MVWTKATADSIPIYDGLNGARFTACSLGLSAISQQYFSLRTNQPPATSQQYFYLRINQHQPPVTSQTNRTLVVETGDEKNPIVPHNPHTVAKATARLHLRFAYNLVYPFKANEFRAISFV